MSAKTYGYGPYDPPVDMGWTTGETETVETEVNGRPFDLVEAGTNNDDRDSRLRFGRIVNAPRIV